MGFEVGRHTKWRQDAITCKLDLLISLHAVESVAWNKINNLINQEISK